MPARGSILTEFQGMDKCYSALFSRGTIEERYHILGQYSLLEEVGRGVRVDTSMLGRHAGSYPSFPTVHWWGQVRCGDVKTWTFIECEVSSGRLGNGRRSYSLMRRKAYHDQWCSTNPSADLIEL